MPSKVDIVSICSYHGIGGASNLAGSLTKSFRERGYSAEIVFLFNKDDDYNCGVEAMTVISEHIPRTIWEWFSFYKKCRTSIAKCNASAGLGFHPFSNIIGSLFLGWNSRFISTQAWPSHKQGKMTEKIESILIKTRLINGNVAVSNDVKGTFSHRGEKYNKKTSIIYNAPSNLPECVMSKVEAKKYFNIDSNSVALGLIGRLHEQKNFELAIKAMPHLEKNYLLYIAGAGPQERYLKELCVKLNLEDRVTFLGPLRSMDVSIFYRSIDIMLMTSIYEGHPLVMLEAMSQRVPIVAHDIPVLREAGRDGVFYVGSDPIQWAHLISNLKYKNLSLKIEKAAEIASEVSHEGMVDSYLEKMGLPPYKNNVQA